MLLPESSFEEQEEKVWACLQQSHCLPHLFLSSFRETRSSGLGSLRSREHFRASGDSRSFHACACFQRETPRSHWIDKACVSLEASGTLHLQRPPPQVSVCDPFLVPALSRPELESCSVLLCLWAAASWSCLRTLAS